MSRIEIQCSGSGRAVTGSTFGAKRSPCGKCGRMIEVTNGGRLRKHTRVTTRAALRRDR